MASFSSTKRLSYENKSTIGEAKLTWISGNNKTRDGRERIGEVLKKLGWHSYYSGGYKKAYFKNGIVIKFAYNPTWNEAVCEVRREAEQWLTAPRKLRKYLITTYDFIEEMLIQSKCYGHCSDPYNCNYVDEAKVTSQCELHDAEHNHGHTKRGKLKFFDWVWNRRWSAIENLGKIPLLQIGK